MQETIKVTQIHSDVLKREKLLTEEKKHHQSSECTVRVSRHVCGSYCSLIDKIYQLLVGKRKKIELLVNEVKTGKP